METEKEVNNEGALVGLADDCLLQMFRFLCITDVLMFGCINRYYCRLVSSYIRTVDDRAQFIFTQRTYQRVYRIVFLFGNYLRNADMIFFQTIPADLFIDGFESFINGMEHLTLRVHLEDPDETDGRFGELSDGTVNEWYETYRRSATNIFNLLEMNLPNLTILTFYFRIDCSGVSYERFLYAYCDLFEEFVNQCNTNLFQYLRRGNIVSNRTHDNNVYRTIFTLEFTF